LGDTGPMREAAVAMFLEQRSVSRKTPLDGRLEISAASAEQLGALGAEFPVAALGRERPGRLESLECGCGKAADARHVHHFVVSPLLRGLAVGSEVRLEVDETRGALHVEEAE
jgi:hypothetical protein